MPGGIHPPLSVIATWRPNYVNPETRGGGVLVMEIVLLVACYVTVGLRLWTRLVQSHSFGYDDALIIFNLVRDMSLAPDGLHSRKGTDSIDRHGCRHLSR
jgi:hypothetical protein